MADDWDRDRARSAMSNLDETRRVGRYIGSVGRVVYSGKALVEVLAAAEQAALKSAAFNCALAHLAHAYVDANDGLERCLDCHHKAGARVPHSIDCAWLSLARKAGIR